MTVTQDTPSANLTCTINSAKIDVFIHTNNSDDDAISENSSDDGSSRIDPNQSSPSPTSIPSSIQSQWDDIIRASGLIDSVQYRDRWQVVNNNDATDHYYEMMVVDSYGGFKASITGMII